MSEHSIAETITWDVDLGDHPDFPARPLSALEIGVEVVVATRLGDEVCRVGLDDDRLEAAGQQTVRLTLPPRALPEAGRYQLQAAVDVDGQQLVVPREADRIRVVDAVV